MSINIGISGKSIYDAFDGKVNIFDYHDIEKNFNSIEQIFKNGNNKAAILYKNTDNYGHWVGMWRIKNRIHFFDSYGFKPDKQKIFNRDYFEKNYNKYPKLVELMLKSPNYKYYFNEYKLQGIDTDTCGRWVINRMTEPYIYLNDRDYYKLFSKFNNKDKIIFKLTNNIR